MENNLTYSQNGIISFPNLTLSEPPGGEAPGQVRADAPELPGGTPSRVIQFPASEEKLFPHLREIDETANRRLAQMMPELMKSAGVTEELKASDPMKWVGLMNTLKAQAEEILLTELIYN